MRLTYHFRLNFETTNPSNKIVIGIIILKAYPLCNGKLHIYLLNLNLSQDRIILSESVL